MSTAESRRPEGAAASPEGPAGAGRPPAEDARLRSAKRIAYGALAVLLVQIPMWVGVLLWTFQIDGAFSGRDDARMLWAVMWAALAGCFVLAGTAAWLLRVRLRGGSRWARSVFWASAVLALGVLAALGPNLNASVALGTWWAVATLAVTPRHAAASGALLLAAPVAQLPWVPEEVVGQMAVLLVFFAAIAAILRLLAEGMVRLLDMAEELIAGREAQARLAVSEERLRFARDMHDLLGHSLSGIAVKSELARRLAERDPGRAGAEMAEVQLAAREALRDVRSAVTGYRKTDLAGDLERIGSVLRAAGTECRVRGGAADVPLHLHDAVAWLLREAATNVVRHSGAAQCEIALRPQRSAVVVEVHDDGAPRSAPVPGSGLTGLTERTAAEGGSLWYGRTSTGFLVRAVFPAGAAGSAAEGGVQPAGTARTTDERECEAEPGAAPDGSVPGGDDTGASERGGRAAGRGETRRAQ
ncbi:sensor histidine kinase [Nocardiopsis coralliicola]